MELFGGLEALPEPARRMLGGDGFFSTAAWWRAVWAAGVPDGATPLFALSGPAECGVVFALLRTGDGGFAALTNPYTCLYQPAAAPGADLVAAGRALGRLGRTAGSLRLEALDPDWPGLAPLLAGTRQAGLVPLRFAHFANWHEDTAGRDWRGYLAARPGALRETVRRRLRDAERDASLTFAVITAAGELPAAIAEYESVYASSWKEPEPFPDFNAALMHQAAAEGWLRLGVLRRAGQAIAVQLWIVRHGVAAVLKLAHDEAFKPLSPGTVLTAWMIRRLLADEAVVSIDFGRGDDAYKRLWTASRRARIGVVLANPWRPAGLAMLLRHGAGLLRRKLRGGRPPPVVAQ
ncbi:MAG: GNAT family N-acetyltransferase [Acetobacteraceae bacterium]|nr:GNAT family N-acetyltransferase [Acetobacteraceae bacterium]